MRRALPQQMVCSSIIALFLVSGVYIAHYVLLSTHSFLNCVQTSVAKRGVINDWLNDWFGGSTAHQNLQSQGLLVAQNYHTISNDVRRLLPFTCLSWSLIKTSFLVIKMTT
jgi:hypothetical protein